MSGHSKWSKVKHQKATTDAVKSRAFTRASRAVTVAVKEGGGIMDPNKNFRLRLAIELARSVNMPKEKIERAIERGGGAEAANIQTIIYEGYGPGGVAYLVEVTTDNTNRTASLMKHQFDRAGGSITSPGAVNFLFMRNGVVLIQKDTVSLDALLDAAIMSGADDVVERDDVFEVYMKPDHFVSVKDALARQYTVTHADVVMRPSQLAHPNEENRAKNDQLISDLELLDDVQTVYTTMD